MNLSRRSLGASLVLHGFLAVGGYFLLQAVSQEAVVSLETGVRTVVTRPLKVRPSESQAPPSPGQNSSSRSVSPLPTLPPSPQNASRSSASVPEGSEQQKVETDSATRKVNLGKAYPQAPKRIPVRSQSPQKSKPDVASPEPVRTPRGWGVTAESPAESKTGENGQKSLLTRRAMPISQPEFNLSERFPNLESVSVKAEFKIAADGTYEPTLLNTSGDPTADVVILARLLEYQWLPAMEKGVPKDDVRILDINLEN